MSIEDRLKPYELMTQKWYHSLLDELQIAPNHAQEKRVLCDHHPLYFYGALLDRGYQQGEVRDKGRTYRNLYVSEAFKVL